jgi:hypothetical protein
MRTYTILFARRAYDRVALAMTVAIAWLTTDPCRSGRARAEAEEGSETTEKAVITAIALGLAVGLGAAITAVVHKYQGQIH